MTTLQEAAMRDAFEAHWLKTRGAKKAKYELTRHPLQPQVYIQDSANRHWVTWRAALAQQGEQPVCACCGIPAGDVHMSTCQSGKWPSRVSNGDTAAPAPQPAQGVPEVGFGNMPVKFLANGMRFKLSLDDEGKVGCFWNLKELDGRWVALVAAEDNCHLQSAQPIDTSSARVERTENGGHDWEPNSLESGGIKTAAQPAQCGDYANAFSDGWEAAMKSNAAAFLQSAQPVAPLTPDEITAVYKASHPKYDIRSAPDEVIAFVRAIEAARGISDQGASIRGI